MIEQKTGFEKPITTSFRSLIVLAVVVICFLGITNRDLWTPDEPRVAAIALEMSQNGNLVIPHLAGQPFIEKPPLYFIVAAGLVRAAGPIIGNTGAIRLTSTLFALATLLVTFLLARRFGGKTFAFSAMIILGTMAGFIENFHWIRVDTALSFFVVATIWCFAETYFGQRARFLPLAGLFAAGAFLSKGLIGPLLIAIAWTGLFISWLRQPEKNRPQKNFFLTEHFFALLIFILLAGLWMGLLRLSGGKELWHEWFWVNHVGRLTGSAASKGHLRPGRPFYYMVSLILYSLPWLPLVLCWLFKELKKIWRERRIAPENLFFIIWGLGTILFLSCSVTKRSIYLYPALPAFAMMAAQALQEGATTRWFQIYTTIWTIICAAVMFFWTILPLAAGLLPASLPNAALTFLSSFGGTQLLAGGAFCICLYLLGKGRHRDQVLRFFTATVLLYIVALSGPLTAVDRAKSMKAGMHKFAGQIAMEKRKGIAGWDFSETMLANFYYYCNWSVPQIESEERLQALLEHKDSQFDSVIINGTRSLDRLLKVPYHIIEEGNPRNSRKNRKKIYWIAGPTLNKQTESKGK